MKKITLMLLFTAVSICSFAKPVDLITAQKVATSYFNHFNADVQSTLIKSQFSNEGSNPISYYIFDFSPKGFIIVSADDRCIPIIGYSTEGNYVEPAQGNTFKFWMDRRTTEIQYIIKNNLPADENINKQWNDGMNNTIARAKTGSSILPLLNSIIWNQSNYYNYYCPADASSAIGNGKVPVGCVATAMAQIMKYWDYPWQGVGSTSYNASGYGTQSANFGSTLYDFKDMKNSAVASSYTQIATLMYHCGVAVNMSYGASGSGAQMSGTNYPSAQKAYTTYFRYNTTKLKAYSQSNFTTPQWITMIENELNLRRPIQYDGFDPSNEGHSWVCDGYDTNDNLHMNWGWGGQDDIYFAVGALNPSSLGAGGGSGGGFNSGDGILIGIEPNGDPYEGTNGDNTTHNAYQVPLTFSNDSTAFITNYASIHTLSDTDYYAFNLPAGYNYAINSSVYDKLNHQTIGNYTEDAYAQYEIGTSNWGVQNDDTIAPFVASGGNTVYYRVYPFVNTVLGSYRLNVRIKRTAWATGIENLNSNKIVVYPNPANNTLNVSSQSMISSIEIINVLGQVVKTQTPIEDNKTMFDISALTNGIYFIKVKDAEQLFTQKITVNH